LPCCLHINSTDLSAFILIVENIFFILAGRRKFPSRLWVVTVATGEARVVNESDAIQPNWSPDGERLAYTAYLNKSYIMDLTKPFDQQVPEETPNFPNSQAYFTAWDWSPDGKYLAGNQGETDLLASCYRESLWLAVANRVETIAFPAISCGVYCYPVEQAAKIAVNETANFLATDSSIRKVYLTCLEGNVFKAYTKALADWL
jgi:dipeptidyl aminopeptidase/acylaminoacyl peptidase